MATTSFILQSMAKRDPFLRSNLLSRRHQEDLHQSYLKLSQSITDVLNIISPPTPEPEVPKLKVKRSDGRRSRSRSRRSNRGSAVSSILDKYRVQPTPTVRSSRQGKKKEKRKQPKPEVSFHQSHRSGTSVDAHSQTYSIRYSKVLDMFKRKIYRDIISALGLDIHCLEDPDIVEIDLAWCKVGSFILESRGNTGLSFAQFLEDTTTIGPPSMMDGDFDDRLSMYSSFLPPIGKRGSVSVRSKTSRMGAASPSKSVISDKDSFIMDVPKKTRMHSHEDSSTTVKQSKVPKLPKINEDITIRVDHV